MVEKKFSFFSKKFCTMFLFAALTAFIISSCKEKEADEYDPNTLPMANFFYEIQYVTLDDYDANTYAKVTATNNSAFSNRWKWSRPGSIEKLDSKVDSLYRPTTFETKNGDSIITQYYLATDQEQKYTITLIAYSDVVVSVDSTRTFESHPFVREITVKKPK